MEVVFSVYDHVSPYLLQEAHDYVHLLVASHPTQQGVSRQGKATGSRMYKSSAVNIPHTLQRVLSAVQSAHQANNSNNGDTLTSSNEGEPCVEDVRQILQSAYGVSEGSRLHRRWVARPRQVIDSVVDGLSRAVMRQYRRHMQHAHRSSATTRPDVVTSEATWVEDALDVHVQLLPRPDAPSALPATFMACVVIRRKDILAQRAQSQRALERCFTAVSAPGQTLTSALAFWEGVSYDAAMRGRRRVGHDDAAARAVRVGQEEPLGLTRLRGPRARMAAEYEMGRRAVLMRRRHCQSSAKWALDKAHGSPKRDGGDMDSASESGGGAAAAAEREGGDGVCEEDVSEESADEDEDESRREAPVILGEDAWSSTQRVCGGSARHGSGACRSVHDKPTYCQPRMQTAFHAPSETKPRGGGGGAATDSIARQSFCGLEYVVYVSLEAMAYVAYPPQPPQEPSVMSAEGEQNTKGTAGIAHTEKTASTPKQYKSRSVMWCGLTLETSTSFTRGLIGLS